MNYFDVIPDKQGCQVRGCRHEVRGQGRFCRRCRDRRYKSANPISYAWDKLRYNARRRGKVFTLTKEYFRRFCEVTGYVHASGKTAGSLSIDRIDSAKGYEPGNIQILTPADNTRKQAVEAKLLAYAPGENPFE